MLSRGACIRVKRLARDRAGTVTSGRVRLPAGAGRLVAGLLHRVALLRNPMTVGVRAILLDAEDRVFLVRHSYVPGWHLPGGGVDAGETIRQAVAREVREEAGLVVGEAPLLVGVYLNEALAGRDHVAVFLIHDPVPAERPSTDWEIVERGFYARDALPAGVTAPTLARLAEALDGVAPSETW